jgi:hypothetical protein
MDKPILLVLAAGMGSRYGSLKQMEPLGKNGEVLLDFSSFDAMREGFGRIVFVIRHDFEQDFRDVILSRVAGQIPCELAFQEQHSLLPPSMSAAGRAKPWGTAHAIACAAPLLDAPFAVINADDFYGRSAFAALAAHLSAGGKEGAIVPYRLDRVLSPQGTVTRGDCDIRDGYLAGIVETYNIRKIDNVIRGENESGSARILSENTPVSMNCWGFPAHAKDMFMKYWLRFIAVHADDPKKECLLPEAAMDFIKNGEMKVKALDADSEWFGITYKEDREVAVARLINLTEQGAYPAPLWAT